MMTNNKIIHELFKAQVDRTPKGTALIFGKQCMTYEELNEKSNKVAWLLRKKGIKRDMVVGIIAVQSFEMIIGILGILKAGGAFLPIDPSYPAKRIKYMIDDSCTNILLTQEHLKDKICFNGEIIILDNMNVPNLSTDNLDNVNQPNDLAYIIYTSGSTGNPKGVMIEHKSVVNFIEGVIEKIDFRSLERILAITTICFDIFILETLLPLTQGMIVVIAPNNYQKNPKLQSRLIQQCNIDIVQMTPSRLQLLEVYDNELLCLKNVKVILIGGEAVQPILLKKLQRFTHARIYNMYGPTETTIWSTISELTMSQSINIGRPIKNTCIYIMNDNHDICSEGVEGELCIGGDGLARGYMNKGELTREKFLNISSISEGRIYRTGDLAKILPDGNIGFIGRIDRQVKIRGYRIELNEIELCLLKNEFIYEAAVIAKQDKYGIKHLWAAVSSRDGTEATYLKDYLRKKLPEYMIPEYFVRLEHLPLTPNGKIDRRSIETLCVSMDQII